MSEQKTDKVFIGGGKKITGQYGDFRSVSICLSKIPADAKFEYNGEQYVKLNIGDKKEADQYGKDVSVSINDWKPSEAKVSNSTPKTNAGSDDDLPF
jgi:hypothetical protein